MTASHALTSDSNKRKTIPMATGVLDYFPAALAAVAELSRVGNDKHNPGQPLHHARGKSSDHADCIVRHLVDRGTIGDDNIRHSTSVAWRALALLQEELEREEGAPLPRGAWLAEERLLEALVEAEPQSPFKCIMASCGSTDVWGSDVSEPEIRDAINNRRWGAIPCDNIDCGGHLVFA